MNWQVPESLAQADEIIEKQAAMLSKQDAAIKQLREALITHQKSGLGDSTDYKTQHAAYMGAHKALAATEEFK
jgi:hypothetical protein